LFTTSQIDWWNSFFKKVDPEDEELIEEHIKETGFE